MPSASSTKLLYKYPKSVDRNDARIREIQTRSEDKKNSRKSLMSITAGVIIIVVALISDISWFKLPIVLVGVYSIALSYFISRLKRQMSDTKCYTKIYNDHIDHCQIEILGPLRRCCKIDFDNIVSYKLNSIGGLCIVVDNLESVGIVVEGSKGKRRKSTLKGDSVTLYFQDIEARRFLVDLLDKRHTENVKAN